MERSSESGIGEGREGKHRGKCREAREVTGVGANVPTTDSLGKRYGVVDGWGIAAGMVEVLLVLSGLVEFIIFLLCIHFMIQKYIESLGLLANCKPRIHI